MNIPTIVCWLCHVQVPGYRTVQVLPNNPYTGPIADYYIGYSQGCTGLRETLLAGRYPARGVLTVDGTHSSWPVMAPKHIALWETLAAKATAGELRWDTLWLDNHRYMEHGGASAYASTASVMRRALGLDEDPSHAVIAPTIMREEGKLRAIAYPCKTMDAAMHQAIGAHVDFAARRMIDESFALTDGGIAPSGLTLDTLPKALCYLAGQDLALGLAELTGSNIDDPDILALGAQCRRGGNADRVGKALLGIALATRWPGNVLGGVRLDWTKSATPVPIVHDETAWCAVYATSLYLRAFGYLAGANLRTPKLSPRISVREVCEDAAAEGILRVVGEDDYTPQFGDFAIEGRNGANPLKGGEGHIRLIVEWSDGLTYRGIGGNESNQLTAGQYDKHDAIAFVSNQGV